MVKWLMHIQNVLNCSINKSLSISAALDYMHWGEMVEEVVDQALLIRTMFIHGEMADKCPSVLN